MLLRPQRHPTCHPILHRMQLDTRQQTVQKFLLALLAAPTRLPLPPHSLRRALMQLVAYTKAPSATISPAHLRSIAHQQCRQL